MVFNIVLEPSWVDLGSSWVPSWCHFLSLAGVLQCFLNIHFFEKIRLQDATWTDLGPMLGRFRGAKRLQNGSLGGQKVR